MKVYCLTAKDEFELTKKINEFDKEIKATQPMQKLDGTWVAFIYYISDAKSEIQGKSFITSKYNSAPEYNKKKFIPTDKQLENWKNEPITEKQAKALRKKGLTEVEISNITKFDAYNIIKGK